MKKLIGAMLCALMCATVQAQTPMHGKVWTLGAGYAYTVAFFADTVTTKLTDSISGRYYASGHSSICDSAGNLLFSTSGYDIYDRYNGLMSCGDTIVPHGLYEKYSGINLAHQSSIILPTSKANKYYVFMATVSDEELPKWLLTPSAGGRAIFDLLQYHIVDMTATGGLGAVVNRDNTLLDSVLLSKSHMTAVRHTNGIDWWLVKQAHDTNLFYTFRVTTDTILGPYLQGFAEPKWGGGDLRAQSAFSKDGTRYATMISYPFRKVWVADFNRTTGLFSDAEMYAVPYVSKHWPIDTTLQDSIISGVAFSPNGRFLYTSGYSNIFQCDLQDTNPATQWVHLAGLDTSWYDFPEHN